MEKRLSKLEAEQKEHDFRLGGIEYMIEDSVVQLVGALAAHLAKNGHLDLKAFEEDLRDEFDPDMSKEDATGTLFSRLAALISFYRRDGVESGYGQAAKGQVLSG